MSTSKISRRDFIKLASIIPLLLIDWPDLNRLSQISYQDPSMPNVIILLFDTFSARHLSMFGYPRPSTPNLERFARKATVYHRHYAAGNFTTPGTASIFTGTYPWSHRAFHLEGTMIQRYAENNIFSLLPRQIHRAVYSHNINVNLLFYQLLDFIDKFIPMKELSLGGNSTFDSLNNPDRIFMQLSEKYIMYEDIHSSPFAPLISNLISLAKEWDFRQRNKRLYPRGLPNTDEIYFLLEEAIDTLASLLEALPQPHIVYYHLLPPHEPYTPRRDFVGIFEGTKVAVDKLYSKFSTGFQFSELEKQRMEYDEYIAFVDSEFGRLYDYLGRTGILDNSYLILTSDHGQLFERGILGHMTPVMYEPLIHVPLFISKPGQTQREDVYTPTSNVDLLPTLLHLYNQPIPDWCEGYILPHFNQENYPAGRSVYVVDAKENYKTSPITIGTSVIIKGSYKLVWYQGYDGSEDPFYELFDLSADPEELNNLYESKPSTASELLAELSARQNLADQPYRR